MWPCENHYSLSNFEQRRNLIWKKKKNWIFIPLNKNVSNIFVNKEKCPSTSCPAATVIYAVRNIRNIYLAFIYPRMEWNAQRIIAHCLMSHIFWRRICGFYTDKSHMQWNPFLWLQPPSVLEPEIRSLLH